MVSEGFQRGLKPSGVSEGSETVRSFRGVSEGSETVRGFRGVQRGLKPSVFIGRNPKEFKEVFGQKHPNTKSYQFLLGKSRQKETLKKQCGRTA